MDEMNITNAKYFNDPISGLSNTMIKATIDGVELWVPNDAPGNRHYAEIQRQVKAGELTIAEAD